MWQTIKLLGEYFHALVGRKRFFKQESQSTEHKEKDNYGSISIKNFNSSDDTNRKI